MSISSISGSSTTQATRYVVSQRQERRQDDDGGVLGVAAQALNLSKSELSDRLRSGKSLAEIAEAQGVSRDDLTEAIKGALPSDSTVSADEVDSAVNTLLDQTGLEKPPPPPPFSSTGNSTTTGLLSGTLTDDQQNTLDTLSDLLGTDSDSLLEQLQTGTSLAQLIENSGVSKNALASVLQDGLLFDTRA
ncbi:hypothetical protein KIH74_29050 [Kineosporia sp. J2-2]|uniref:Uncharacterized protein n=1 Tax=Kineosporia corallincola TaxID=2835133 RepID=A0ABS5TPK1_9ACTN|nr:hypothetical protein [Kineosporia corallincola]MBT0773026.1 hypothetical protein [Kineosporia corallincola]